jgi:Ala-tRNA(Pro) deacylase
MYVSLSKLKKLADSQQIELATEREFRHIFPDCETGAMPPLGNLYRVPVYIDQSFEGRDIVFNAGSHREAIKMHYDDFVSLVEPVSGHFAHPFDEGGRRFQPAW